jgi:hypothetical protein
MPKLNVITNREGRILGSVRSDPIETEIGTVQFQRRPTPEVKYYELDVTEELLHQPAERVHEYLLKELKRLNLV